MISCLQEEVCFKCKYHVFRMSHVAREFDTITCKRNRDPRRCYYDPFEDTIYLP